jgi:outer membrane protein assembly factor BamA
VYIAADVFSTSLDDLNALVLYNYLPRRTDFSVGLFHSKNYLNSSVTSLGEPLGRPRDFSERNYGGLFSAAYPIHRYQRVELGYLQSFVERTFYDRDEFGQYFAAGTEFRSVSSPSVSLVGDNALFGYYGPVNGERYTITYAPSFDWFANGVSYQTVTLDTRHYLDLTHGYGFATRILAGASSGPNAQVFRVGGFSTLRGYDDFSLVGSRVVILNNEFRFPFIHQLGLVGPVPVGIFNLRGVGFVDAGLVWNQGDPLRLTRYINGSPRLESPRVGFGCGIRSSILYMILKLDVGWNTDLRDASSPHWYFSIGPEF